MVRMPVTLGQISLHCPFLCHGTEIWDLVGKVIPNMDVRQSVVSQLTESMWRSEYRCQLSCCTCTALSALVDAAGDLFAR